METEIRKLADRMVLGKDTSWAMGLGSFDWVPGVGLHGIYLAYEATGDERYRNYLVDWIETYLSQAHEKLTVNSTAPLMTVLDIWGKTKKADYLRVCEDIAQYIVTDAPRTANGGLEHTVTEAVAGFREQIWADTLFMVCIFLAKLGCVSDPNYAAFARQQLAIHLNYLEDKQDHLYYHGWSQAAQSHLSGIKWGRANAWVLYSGMAILDTLGAFDGRDAMVEKLRQHAAALAGVQRADGTFGTILNDADAYSELSATAGIVAGLAYGMRTGVLDSTYREACERGLAAVGSAINDAGELTGVSSGTPILPDAQAYKTVPIEPTLYGQALGIAAFVQMAKL